MPNDDCGRPNDDCIDKSGDADDRFNGCGMYCVVGSGGGSDVSWLPVNATCPPGKGVGKGAGRGAGKGVGKGGGRFSICPCVLSGVPVGPKLPCI